MEKESDDGMHTLVCFTSCGKKAQMIPFLDMLPSHGRLELPARN